MALIMAAHGWYAIGRLLMTGRDLAAVPRRLSIETPIQSKQSLLNLSSGLLQTSSWQECPFSPNRKSILIRYLVLSQLKTQI
jgi:hypothetical protein